MSRYEFIYLCDKNFDDLQGDDARQRFCPACEMNVVNFDAISDEEQSQLLQQSAQNGERLCASTRLENMDAAPCPSAANEKNDTRLLRLTGIVAPSSGPRSPRETTESKPRNRNWFQRFFKRR